MDFQTAIDRVLSHEGGYVNPKPGDDPGGETNWGISKRSYPNLDIRSLNRDQAVNIYRRDFWDKVHADEMPSALAYQALDFAVNSGIETAIRKLQFAAGVADDGHWGPITRAAVASKNVSDLLMLYIAERMDFQRKLKNFLPNAGGWTARNAQNLRLAAQDN